jgi:hypothetical protein
MDKQEVIKKAYGEYWELVKDLVRPDGSLSEAVWMGSGMEMIPYQDYSTGYLRPLSLVGIENNNGWVKIESEEDLPKKSGDYWVILNDGRISQYSSYDHEDILCKGYMRQQMTHYQPIQKPKPPIY